MLTKIEDGMLQKEVSAPGCKEDDQIDENPSWYSNMAGEVLIPEYGEQVKMLVGSLSAAENTRLIHDLGVTHILTVAGKLHANVPSSTVKHKTVECDDHPMFNILKVLPECMEFIGSAMSDDDGCVLVHCASGISRSVTTCVAFLMIRFGMKKDDALELIRSRRQYANPNYGFRRQLEMLELKGCNVTEAAEQWSKETSKDFFSEVQRQRDAVNTLHARVDDVENKIAQKRSVGENTDVEQKDLAIIQMELDSCLPAQGEGFVDAPSGIIRKSALQKVQRLLSSFAAENQGKLD
mmetsp:Transcript_15679/g.21488  ORF Transcript_15679/g.21488 Transcript_15679/m.21488 type:complete len:294 (-) Transcript_15679:139-1020(-)|eukprot:CAMPEP_0185724150 /NCGR_PEP_ID=MMETSP1171-20130828/712_1 /TAXON_ID=374046 /ORGANISM="Helicotheca tamensis, Strain CCMP826" /LENGTH=293 /DNA_ID=CAMNT_0028391935 /DNA_START=77 /DNA_END=958 /DNA_ORIENTATION=+